MLRTVGQTTVHAVPLQADTPTTVQVREPLAPNAPVSIPAPKKAWPELLLAYGKGATAAVLMGLTGCATTGQGPRIGAPLSKEPPGPPPLSQLDYPQVQLGTGRYTIGSSGCFLTSLTMATSLLHQRKDLDPVLANSLVKQNDGFSGSGLELSRAAPALGLRVLHRAEINDQNRSALDQRLDAALAAGKPVVMGVDFAPGASSGESDADHFILVYGQLGTNRYRALDPAGGVKVELERAADGTLHYRGSSERKISEMLFLDRGTFVRDPTQFR